MTPFHDRRALLSWFKSPSYRLTLFNSIGIVNTVRFPLREALFPPFTTALLLCAKTILYQTLPCDCFVGGIVVYNHALCIISTMLTEQCETTLEKHRQHGPFILPICGVKQLCGAFESFWWTLAGDLRHAPLRRAGSQGAKNHCRLEVSSEPM